MTTEDEWQAKVGRNWAETYQKTDRSFAGLTQYLLQKIADLPGESVLDIGCGAGELSLAMVRARPRATIIGLDISSNLVAAACQRGGERSQLEFVVGDAAAWSREGFKPDLLVSRHGVMFFADPVAAFAHLRELAHPGANLVFSCFRTAKENPWASGIAAMLPHSVETTPANPRAPGPFAFADPQYVQSILSEAGWTVLDFSPVDYAFIAGYGDDPVTDAADFFSRIGPAAATLRELEGAARESFQAELVRWLEEHRRDSLVAFPAAGWIVSARND